MAKSKNKPAPAVNMLESKRVSIADVRPNLYNPNHQNDDDFYLLVLSIAEDGFTDDIFVHNDGHIVDGEHRWTAMIVLNYLRKNNIPLTEAEVKKARERRDEIIDPSDVIGVKYTDMDEVKRRVATLRHNRARGDENMELVANMFRDFERQGALEAVQGSLGLEDEEIERMLKYGQSILDDFPGDAPSPAWEPRETVAGQVPSWTDTGANFVQSVSKAAATPAPPVDASPVPGLGVRAPDYVKPEVLGRRVFVLTETELKIVDQALGDTPAQRLVELCSEWIKQHESVS